MLVNVPLVEGVPAINSAIGAAQDLTLATRDTVGDVGAPTWGIFKGGAPVIVADTVLAVDYKKESSVSDFPVERGEFESYNKVRLPFDARVRFGVGGSEAARAATIASIEALSGTTQIFDVVTPELVMSNVTITHHDFRRTGNSGLGLLQIEVWCLEIRETANAAQGSTTAEPDGASATSTGSVQAQPASDALKAYYDESGKKLGTV